ncbi:response regulator [Pseudaeromonas paramecii]|uniref:Response regulator n=1 Tax=Pseudaeromonas paramecii TaxID=2138166 RepID=A0ABP8QI99_9GAMM
MEKETAIEAIKIIPSLTWAIIGFFAIKNFKTVISENLLPRMTSIKAAGFEASFEKEVKDALDNISIRYKDIPIGSTANREQVARRANRIYPILQKTKILLVDDEPKQISFLINILERLDIVHQVAISTEDAIVRLGNQNFDLIISDIKRRDDGSAGIHMLKKLKDMKIEIPTIFYINDCTNLVIT